VIVAGHSTDATKGLFNVSAVTKTPQAHSAQVMLVPFFGMQIGPAAPYLSGQEVRCVVRQGWQSARRDRLTRDELGSMIRHDLILANAALATTRRIPGASDRDR
jgi:hypothetical protein